MRVLPIEVMDNSQSTLNWFTQWEIFCQVDVGDRLSINEGNFQLEVTDTTIHPNGSSREVRVETCGDRSQTAAGCCIVSLQVPEQPELTVGGETVSMDHVGPGEETIIATERVIDIQNTADEMPVNPGGVTGSPREEVCPRCRGQLAERRDIIECESCGSWCYVDEFAQWKREATPADPSN